MGVAQDKGRTELENGIHTCHGDTSKERPKVGDICVPTERRLESPGRIRSKASQMPSALNAVLPRGVQPAAQNGYECSPTQTINLLKTL